MSTYVGTVTPGALNWAVTVDDGALAPRLDLANHSPSGFAWGYGGSGPSQLALAILAHHYRAKAKLAGLGREIADRRAVRRHQDFKRAVIAKLDQDKGFTLTSDDVQAALDAMRAVHATVIHVDGRRERVHPQDGKEFKLRQLQALVGDGLIEVVPIPSMPKYLLLVDEEGLYKKREINAVASGYATRPIVGPAVLLARRDFK